MKSKFLKLPAIILVVVNLIYGNFWLSGFYYCQKGLAVWAIIALFFLYSEKIFLLIKKARAAKIAKEEKMMAEDLKFAEALKRIEVEAKVEAEVWFKNHELQEKEHEKENTEKIFALISKAVEDGVRKALQ